MKKLLSTELTAANVAQALELLAGTPGRLAALSDGLADEQLRRPLGAGERSCVETLAHLLNAESRASEAIYLALLADEPALVVVHPERQWGKLLRYDLLPFAELLAYFQFRRAVLLRVLTALPARRWSRVARRQRHRPAVFRILE